MTSDSNKKSIKQLEMEESEKANYGLTDSSSREKTGQNTLFRRLYTRFRNRGGNSTSNAEITATKRTSEFKEEKFTITSKNGGSDLEEILTEIKQEIKSELKSIVRKEIVEDIDEILNHKLGKLALQGSLLKSNYKSSLKLEMQNKISSSHFIEPMPGKDQDYAYSFKLGSGDLVGIICDGVSSDGPKSRVLSHALPHQIENYMQMTWQSGLSLEEWERYVEDCLNYSLNKIRDDEDLTNGGATTLLLIVVCKDRNTQYLTWLGDGIIVYNDDSFPGVSIPFYPDTLNRNQYAPLTQVVKWDAIQGKPNCIIMNVRNGNFILASDGYKILSSAFWKHLNLEVLKNQNLGSALTNWGLQICCKDEELERRKANHDARPDDRSILIVSVNKE